MADIRRIIRVAPIPCASRSGGSASWPDRSEQRVGSPFVSPQHWPRPTDAVLSAFAARLALARVVGRGETLTRIQGNGACTRHGRTRMRQSELPTRIAPGHEPRPCRIGSGQPVRPTERRQAFPGALHVTAILLRLLGRGRSGTRARANRKGASGISRRPPWRAEQAYPPRARPLP